MFSVHVSFGTAGAELLIGFDDANRS